MLQTISVTVIAAAVIVVAAFLIPVVLQIRRTSREVGKLVDTIRLQVAPLGRDLTAISRDAKGMMQSIRRQVDMAEDGLSTVREMAVRLKEFETEVQRRIEEPLLELTDLVCTVTRGLEAFIRIFRRRIN